MAVLTIIIKLLLFLKMKISSNETFQIKFKKFNAFFYFE